MDDDKSPAISDESSPALDVLGDLDSIPIPKAVKRNFFKAIAQLITSAADIPGAKLEAIAQGIRTEANAKSIVTLEAARAAARKIGKDPYLVDRALQAYGARIVGEQANRETDWRCGSAYSRRSRSCWTRSRETGRRCIEPVVLPPSRPWPRSGGAFLWPLVARWGTLSQLRGGAHHEAYRTRCSAARVAGGTGLGRP